LFIQQLRTSIIVSQSVNLANTFPWLASLVTNSNNTIKTTLLAQLQSLMLSLPQSLCCLIVHILNMKNAQAPNDRQSGFDVGCSEQETLEFLNIFMI